MVKKIIEHRSFLPNVFFTEIVSGILHFSKYPINGLIKPEWIWEKMCMKTSMVKSDYQTLIYEFRGFKVMMDFDLAALYV